MNQDPAFHIPYTPEEKQKVKQLASLGKTKFSDRELKASFPSRTPSAARAAIKCAKSKTKNTVEAPFNPTINTSESYKPTLNSMLP